MASEILDIADAVVTALNAEAFQETLDEDVQFEAERLYLPRFDLEDMDTLHVSVVPRAQTEEALTRETCDHEYKIDVAVQKRFEDGDAAELDPLVALVDAIATLFRLKRLDGHTAAAWIRTEHLVLYLPEHMDTKRQFTSVVTFTFKVVK